MKQWSGTDNAKIFAAIVDSYDAHFSVAARNLATGEEILYNAERLCATASVFKVPLLVELIRQAEQGNVSLDERYTLRTRDQCPGTGRLKYLRPGTKLTFRKLATLMITSSDNTAADIILARVGADNVTRTMHAMGLTNTYVTTNCRAILAQPWRHQARGIPTNNSTTALDMINLLTGLYQGRLLSSRGCQTVLEIMKGQRRRWRIPAKLPAGTVTATKSGTVPAARNDIGLVWPTAGPPYAVAIFSRWADIDAASDEPLADISAAIYRYFTQPSYPWLNGLAHASDLRRMMFHLRNLNS